MKTLEGEMIIYQAGRIFSMYIPPKNYCILLLDLGLKLLSSGIIRCKEMGIKIISKICQEQKNANKFEIAPVLGAVINMIFGENDREEIINQSKEVLDFKLFSDTLSKEEIKNNLGLLYKKA